MTALYSVRSADHKFIVRKFIAGRLTDTYHVSEHGCNCPARVWPCRHAKMILRFPEAVDSGHLIDWDHGELIEPSTEAI
jgi:hypothetical protein